MNSEFLAFYRKKTLGDLEDLKRASEDRIRVIDYVIREIQERKT